MKTQIIKKWNGMEPGIYDLPETMVARLKKNGFAKDPEPPKPKKVLVEPKVEPKPKAKKKTKIQKDAYTKDI
jgi:hypothetical protein